LISGDFCFISGALSFPFSWFSIPSPHRGDPGALREGFEPSSPTGTQV
jgi:hypothetical protein